MSRPRSNSAKIPSSWSSIRPTGPLVSIGSVADRNATPAVARSSTMLISPTMERVSRSIR
jgi:hypothetical protein